MRDYALAWELKRAGMDWKSWLFTRWGMTGTRWLVAKLKADPVRAKYSADLQAL